MESGAKTMEESDGRCNYEGVADAVRSKNVNDDQVSVLLQDSSGGDTFTYGQSNSLQTRLYFVIFQGRFKWAGIQPHSKVFPFCALQASPKSVVKWLHCRMFVLVTQLCLAFSDADIEFDFVLMTSAYSPFHT